MADHRDIRERVVVITGASSGFGKGAALRFAGMGANLVLAARRQELLEELARDCELAGVRAIAVPTDVSRREDVERLAREAMGHFGRIDVWVNNAGAGAIGRFEEVPLEDHVRVIEIDLLGAIYGSYYAMRHFRSRGSGILINIASVIGKVPSPYFSSYAAAKHGVVGLSAALRQELELDGIDAVRVCTVLPATFDTPFFEHAAAYTGRQAQPIPPVYDPEKVVEVIVRLASDPEDEVPVGAIAKVATLAHQIFPGLVESRMAKETHKAEVEKSPPASETRGNLQDPKPTGTDVRGGWRKENR